MGFLISMTLRKTEFSLGENTNPWLKLRNNSENIIIFM